MVQRYGDTDTMTDPTAQPGADQGSSTATQRYEEARAAAHRAITNVSVIPDRPLPQAPIEPESLSYRGFKFGAAFFGWLIAIAMGAILTAIVTGATAGTSYVLDYTRDDANQQAGTAAITAASLLVVTVSLAFFIGGYVAGRLARFDGARQGFGVWMLALLATAIGAGAGAWLNNEYDLIGRLERPDVALADDVLMTGSIIAAAALLVLCLLAALLGGKAGQRYHDKIDTLLD